MENSRLQADLLKEFKEEKALINRQLELLDPLAVWLRKPIASRILSSIVLLILEAMSWLSILVVIAFCIIRDKIYPFYVLARMRVKGASEGFSTEDIEALYWSVIVFAVVICFLLFITARNLAKLRKKNAILQVASKTIKIIVGEQLNRRAAIDTIDQRYFGILEPQPMPEIKSTNVPNPGL